MKPMSITQTIQHTRSTSAGRSTAVRRSAWMILVSFFLASGAFAQGVGISESAITPDASAILELRSTTRGFLMPRNSATLGFSVQGLSFYNTTSNRLNYHNGSTWLEVPAKADNLSVFASTTSAQLLGLLSDETGTGLAVFATSPTLTTPNIGVATATSVNNVTITDPGTAATLTLANNSTLATSGAFSTTLTATAATNVTLPTTGTLATVPEIDQITADQTRNLTTFADVPGFSYSLLANSTYYFKFKCLVTTNAATVGILLAVNASAAITSLDYIHMYPTSATAITYERVTVVNGGTLPTAGPGGTQREYELEGRIVTTGAVTFTLRHRSETASITTVKAGSFGMVQKIL